MIHRTVLTAAVLMIATVLPARAQDGATETNILVRVVARDAKLIGDAVGGASVTIRNAETGSILAEGFTTGNTGNTRLIMRTPRARGMTVFDTPGAAGWLATFPLRRPTVVEIVAEGPLDYPQVTSRASKTMLITPGAELIGEGIVLELNGYIVEILEPDVAPSGTLIPVRARVRMLCSCPTAPDGLWSVERVSSRLMSGGAVVAEVPLEFSGEASIYAGEIRAPGPGAYRLEVVAADPATRNFGAGSLEFNVPAAGASGRVP